ncbi:MAG: phage holin family protein, partial [Roseibacillus sp.]|nr:phage holin family protein [Roseibacillus sp.]
GEAVARKGSLAIAAVVFLFFAYALVLVTVVSLLGRWVESLSSQFSGLGWQLTALAAGFLHFLVALALFRKLKQKQELNLFEFTRAEFNKDREWLNQNKTSANENESSS